jgi:hypothetical protein
VALSVQIPTAAIELVTARLIVLSGAKEEKATMESVRMASRFQEALQNPKRQLLFFGGAIFDDAMKFLNQDARIGFLSFEFEEYLRRNT